MFCLSLTASGDPLALLRPPSSSPKASCMTASGTTNCCSYACLAFPGPLPLSPFLTVRWVGSLLRMKPTLLYITWLLFCGTFANCTFYHFETLRTVCVRALGHLEVSILESQSLWPHCTVDLQRTLHCSR